MNSFMFFLFKKVNYAILIIGDNMKKLNNKGYMLVEIILASIIAFGVAYFIIDLTLKLKNRNNDVMVATQVVTDQSIVTNKLIEYIADEGENFDCGELKTPDNKTITYKDNIIDVINDYVELSNENAWTCKNEKGQVNIEIPLEVKQLSKNDYNIKLNYKYNVPTVNVTYSSSNLLYFATNHTDDMSKASYSYNESNDTFTVTAKQNDGFVYTNVRVYLKSGVTYYFNVTTNGTWSATDDNTGSDTVEVFLMKDGGTNPYYHMNSNKDYQFTPTVDGTYWLRFDVNQNGKTYNFSNVRVEQIELRIYNRAEQTVLGELPTMSMNNYSLIGWYTSETGGNQITTTSPIPNEDTTYYAHWKNEMHTITFNSNGGTACKSVQIKKGDKLTSLCRPTRTDYFFGGWYTSNNADSQYNNATYVNNYEDLRNAYGSSWGRYLTHWIENGVTEGRKSSSTNVNASSSRNYTYNQDSDMTLYAQWFTTGCVLDGNGQDYCLNTIEGGWYAYYYTDSNNGQPIGGCWSYVSYPVTNPRTNWSYPKCSSGNASGKTSSSGNSDGGGTNTSGSGITGGGCFLKGTKVVTINGAKDIDKIKIGDLVLTYNEGTNNNEYHKVTKLYAYNPDEINEELYTLTFDDKSILQVSSTHRFYIKRNNQILWLSTKDIKNGDIVMYSNKEYHHITKMEHEKLTQTVYNFSVENTHNYYVGNQEVLVHNPNMIAIK